jgi:hypothetical protein
MGIKFYVLSVKLETVIIREWVNGLEVAGRKTQPCPAFVPGEFSSLGSQQVRPVSFEMHTADGDFIRDRHIAGLILRRIASDHSPVTVVMLLLFLILYFLLNRRQNQMKASEER